MKNWKQFVEKKNAKIYVLPAGWDSKDTIAEQLECSPDKVRDHLRPALASGEVEEKQFKVWQSELGRCILVTAYREAQKEVTASEFDLARAQAMKKDGKSYAEIGAAVGMTGEAVRAKLRRAG
jgi:DNA-binding CsgD family transcriptional regulator